MTRRQRTLIVRAAAIMVVSVAASFGAGLTDSYVAIYAVILIGTAAEVFFGVLPLLRETQRRDRENQQHRSLQR